jgi:hypothetical protein
MLTKMLQESRARLRRVFRLKKAQPANEIVFKIAGKQYRQLVEWERSIDERVFRQELETGRSPKGIELDEDWLKAVKGALTNGVTLPPWYGVSQGAYAYTFVPTTLGLIIKAENTETGDLIDLTDYSDW